VFQSFCLFKKKIKTFHAQVKAVFRPSVCDWMLSYSKAIERSFLPLVLRSTFFPLCGGNWIAPLSLQRVESKNYPGGCSAQKTRRWKWMQCKSSGGCADHISKIYIYIFIRWRSDNIIQLNTTPDNTIWDEMRYNKSTRIYAHCLE